MTLNNIEIGKNISIARKAAKMSQSKLASEIGIDQGYILSKAGGQPWQDAPFTPHYARVKEYPLPSGNLGYSLLLMMTDAASGRIQSLRLIGLGHDFSVKLREVIMESLEKPFDNDEYNAKIDKVYRTYSTKDLLRFSIARFKIAE